ncbi:hypothetical protein [Desulfobulbus oligotrophicus]|jgi:hypothetical protein|uniref:Uncharacterized protein n=1 Tax=Desulfobulbus oligotrophicus TaxID=1909699 RepID=A0A7T5VEY3_9BACT|nr:hypothetical protein [Desulfobulbus oligotrophicus]MDY0391398.1 hypothetical protein [Desulfobulbus oligotrophicus]QQG66675.1 hypothetical protein HP555_12770 [Desulfobulbus oligotrophicus]
MTKKTRPSPPGIGPYVFPVLLTVFGLWCLYDGWLNDSPEMLQHSLFNRIASGVLLTWAVWDLIRIRKHTASKQTDG